jgi:hypothetical protein
MHYLQVSLFKSIKKVLEKTETEDQDKKKKSENILPQDGDEDNLIEVLSEESID